MVIADIHHSTLYMSYNKAYLEPISSHSPSPIYGQGSRVIGGSNWSNGEQYNGVEPFPLNGHERQWIPQQNTAMCVRERRSECDAHPLPAAVQPDYVDSPYMSPSPLPPRSPYVQTPRNSIDINVNPSNWTTNWGNNTVQSMPSSTFAPSMWNNHSNVQIPQFNSQSLEQKLFDNMIFSSDSSSESSTIYTPGLEQAIPLNGFAFPHRFSPGPSPSPSPIHLPSSKSTSSPSSTSRRRSLDRPDTGKSCSHCRATTTPLWRRDPSTMKPLCNACGLYLQQRNKLRPQELIECDHDGNSSDESDVNYVGPECSHCRTHRTSVWRRSKSGEQLCNACGVYARLRGKPRPLSLKRNKIRPRSKHSPKV